jgi:hypothetical protein
MQGVSVHPRDNKLHADVCLHAGLYGINDPAGWPIFGLLVAVSVLQSIHKIDIIELQCSLHETLLLSKLCSIYNFSIGTSLSN